MSYSRLRCDGQKPSPGFQCAAIYVFGSFFLRRMLRFAAQDLSEFGLVSDDFSPMDVPSLTAAWFGAALNTLDGKMTDRDDNEAGKSPQQLGRLNGRLGFKLRIAAEVSSRAFARRTGDASIKPQHYAILAVAGDFPGISQTDLGDRCGRDKSSITPAITQLEKQGLIKRTRFSDDKRAYSVRLTASGKAVLDRLDVHALAHEAVLRKILGKRGYDDAASRLMTLAARLEEMTDLANGE